MARPPLASDTSRRVLDIAARLVQTRGFNGFSYADIADELGITKAALHYHFPSKAELGRALIERYERDFVATLAAIDEAAADERERLRRYARIYSEVLQDDRMCLCGMLAAEYGTLPAPMQQELKHFFEVNEDWLAGLLERGRRRRSLAFEGKPRELARVLIASLEGAMMLALPYQDVSRFRSAAERLLGELEPADEPLPPPMARRGARGSPARTARP